jgi:bacillithiol system protein YtxJ
VAKKILSMNWIALNSIDQLDAVVRESQQQPVLIFKHSTTCNISRTALDRVERNHKPEDLTRLKLYYLDLLAHRDVSNAVAQKFGIAHESPQALLIKHGKATYTASHFEIDYRTIMKQLD